MKTLLLAVVLLNGCALTSVQRREENWKGLGEVDLTASVAVARFLLMEGQDFSHRHNLGPLDNVHQWKEGVGVADLSWRVAQGLAERGFERSSDDRTDDADLQLVGYIFQPLESLSAGRVLVTVLQVLTWVPLPCATSVEVPLVIEVRDREGRLLVEHRADLEIAQQSPYFVMIGAPSIGAIAAAAAEEAAIAIHKAQDAMLKTTATKDGRRRPRRS